MSEHFLKGNWKVLSGLCLVGSQALWLEAEGCLAGVWLVARVNVDDAENYFGHLLYFLDFLLRAILQTHYHFSPRNDCEQGLILRFKNLEQFIKQCL